MRRTERVLICALEELAVRLGLGTSTVHTHRVKLYRKLGVHTRHELRQCLSGDFACEKIPLRARGLSLKPGPRVFP